MPRRSSRVAKQKRVNYNEDAMFYRMTKTKKADWEEVEDLDPVPVYRDKPMYRKRLPKQKKIVKIRTRDRLPNQPPTATGSREPDPYTATRAG